MFTTAEVQSIRLFLKKGLLFSIPFLFYAALLVAVDPFNYFGVSPLINDAHKRATASKLHYTLWKTIDFLRDPRPNLILGDSRMGQIQAARVEEVTGDRYYNFSYGGGTIPELIDTFYFATRHVKVERVYIGASFINFNAFQNRNRFRESQSILANPLLYLVNRIVLKAAYHAVRAQWMGETIDVERPNEDRDAFWNHQLGTAIVSHYGRFKYSHAYVESLRELARYCDANGIALTFLIPPTHVELQAKIAEFGLSAEAEEFNRDLHSLGRVVDMDFDNAFTRDRENFLDPFHTANGDVVRGQLWGDHPNPAIQR